MRTCATAVDSSKALLPIEECKMLSLLSSLILAQANPGAPSTSALNAWYLIAKPALTCERKFDETRRAIAVEQRRLEKLPIGTADNERVWRDGNNALQKRMGDFRGDRDAACKTFGTFLKFRTVLSKSRPDLSPDEVNAFARGLFRELQVIEEVAADFVAGHDSTQFTAPQAPPAAPR